MCLWLILPYLLIQLSLKIQLKSNLSDPRIQILSGNAFDSLLLTTLLHIMPRGTSDHVRKSSVIVHLKLQNYMLGDLRFYIEMYKLNRNANA